MLLLLVFALGYLAYAKRYQLAARIWHWRHGYSATMGSYQVPVPQNWLILYQNSVAFTLMNTAPILPKDANFHTTAVVTVFPFPRRALGAEGMARWLSFQRQAFTRNKAESVEEKTLKFGGESITCIGGSELNGIPRGNANHFETDIVSLDCMSERGLEIQFVGEPSDVRFFYTLVSQIQRKI